MGELKVKSGGSWRTITAPEVKLSGTWRAVQTIEVKSGGVWREVFSAAPAITVTLNTSDAFQGGGGTVYSGIQYKSDGNEWGSSATGTYNVSRDQWLDVGAAIDCWIERDINSGSLYYDNIGAGRVQLNVSRTMECRRTSVGIHTATVTVRVYDAASGGNLLDTEQNIITAQKFF